MHLMTFLQMHECNAYCINDKNSNNTKRYVSLFIKLKFFNSNYFQKTLGFTTRIK